MGFVLIRELSGLFARRRRWGGGVWRRGYAGSRSYASSGSVCVSDTGGGDCERGEVAGDDPVRGTNRAAVVYDRWIGWWNGKAPFW